MTPTAILLITCFSLFIILGTIFSVYLVKTAVKGAKGKVQSHQPAISHFTQSGTYSEERLGTTTGYRLAKAK